MTLACSSFASQYGMTETSPVSFGVDRSASLEKRCQTVGTIYPHCYAKICAADDPAGQPLPINTPGELCTGGYLLMKGYWQDEEKTKEVVQVHQDELSGRELTWMRTGDVAVMDEEGFVKIVGREKDVIIRGGENIFPVIVENSIETLDCVGSSAVVAVPDDRLGEVSQSGICSLNFGFEYLSDHLLVHCQPQDCWSFHLLPWVICADS